MDINMTYSKYKCWKRQVKFTILGFSPLYCCYLLFQGQNSTYPVKVREAFWGSSLVAQLVKNLPAMQETPVKSLGQEDFLEKEMATHCSILAWEIPWIEEPGGLQPMGSQRVGHDWETKPPRDFDPWVLVILTKQIVRGGSLSQTTCPGNCELK